MIIGHPKTCGCGPCRSERPPKKRGGRHPKLCQCAACLRRRVHEYNLRATEKRRASREAIENWIPTEEKPVFVRAHWRKQAGWLSRDPGLRDLLLMEK